MEGRRKDGADGGDAQVREDLGGGSSFAPFGGTESLLLLIAEASRDPRQNEDGHQGHESTLTGAGVEQKTDHCPGYGARDSDSADQAGDQSETQGDCGGSEHVVQKVSPQKYHHETVDFRFSKVELKSKTPQRGTITLSTMNRKGILS